MEKLLHEAHAILLKTRNVMHDALPVVAALATALHGIDLSKQDDVMHAVTAHIDTIVKDAQKVDTWFTSNASAPYASVLHNAAVFIMHESGGHVGTILSDLDTAVQMAFSIYKANPAILGAL